MRGEPTRRDAIRVGAVGVGASLAGCMTTVGLGTKRDKRPEKDQKGHSITYTWTDDDEKDLLELHIYAADQSKPGSYEIPFRFQVWHKEGTHLDSLMYELKPGAGFDHPVIMHWETPNPNWPESNFKTTDRYGMIFEVPDLGEYGKGTVVSNFIAKVPTDGETIRSLPLWFHPEFELSDGMVGGHELSVEDELEIPVQPNR